LRINPKYRSIVEDVIHTIGENENKI